MTAQRRQWNIDDRTSKENHRRPLWRGDPDSPPDHRTGRQLLAALSHGLRADGGLGGDHRRIGLSARQGHQPGLCRQERSRHRDPVAGHDRDLHAQGRRDLRTLGDPVADLQRDPGQQPAPAVRQADDRKHRVLLGSAFVGIPRAADLGRQFRHPGARSFDQRGRTRSAVADRADHRHGDAGSVHGPARISGGAAGNDRAAQAGEADQGSRLQPVYRYRRYSRNHAGIAAGHSHRQGVHARTDHARPHRCQHHGGSSKTPTRWRRSPTGRAR